MDSFARFAPSWEDASFFGLALRHFEKAGLGLALGWLAVVGLGSLSTPTGLQAADQLGVQLDEVSAYHDTGGAGLDLPALPGTDGLEATLDSARVSPASTWPAWIMHRRPGFTWKLPTAPPALTPTHGVPATPSVESLRGRLRVTWDGAPATEQMVFEGYLLERRAEGEESWTPLGEHGASGEVLDDGVQPGVDYRYRLISSARIEERSQLVRDARRDGRLDGSQAATTRASLASQPTRPGSVYLVVPSTVVVADPVARVPCSAFVEIYRWTGEDWGRPIGLHLVEGQVAGESGAILVETFVQRQQVAGQAWTREVVGVRLRLTDGSMVDRLETDRPARR
jgi:hypothetical protein